MRRLLLLALPAVVLFPTGNALGTLIGDSVEGELLAGDVGGAVGTQFISPAIVGAGLEFTGNWLFAPFGMDWRIDVDIDASSFTVTVEEIGPGNNNIFSGPMMMGIALTDLDWVGQPNHVIDGVVQQPDNPDGVSIIDFTDHGITVFWSAFPFGVGNDPPTGGTYGFKISTIPGPGALPLLLALGLPGMRRRRKI